MKRMRKAVTLYACFLYLVGGALVGTAIARAYHLWSDEGYCGWPAVTTCRLCDTRVWEWQDYERRQHTPPLENPQGLAVSVSMSSIFHTQCKGTPEIEPIKVQVVPRPRTY